MDSLAMKQLNFLHTVITSLPQIFANLILKIIVKIKIFQHNFQDGNYSHKCLYILGSKIKAIRNKFNSYWNKRTTPKKNLRQKTFFIFLQNGILKSL